MESPPEQKTENVVTENDDDLASPIMNASIAALVFEYLPFRDLQNCQKVCELFEQLAKRELRTKTRNRAPKHFSWIGERLTDEHQSDKNDLFMSEAHRPLYEKFKAFVDELMFVPKFMIAISTGDGALASCKLTNAFYSPRSGQDDWGRGSAVAGSNLNEKIEIHFRRLYEPFLYGPYGRGRNNPSRPPTSQLKSEKVLRDHFTFDIADLTDILVAPSCEVVSCVAMSTVSSGTLENQEPVYSNFDDPETRFPAFSCFLFPDMNGVRFQGHHGMKPWDIPLIGTGVKFVLYVEPTTCFSAPLSPVNREDFSPLALVKGHIIRYSESKKVDLLHRVRQPDLQFCLPDAPYTLELDEPCALTIWGEGICAATIELWELSSSENDSPETPDSVLARTKACKRKLHTLGALDTSAFIATVYSNFQRIPRTDFDTYLNLFRDVFPKVPILGTLTGKTPCHYEGNIQCITVVAFK